MAQKRSLEQHEHQMVRAEQQAYHTELAEHAAARPRRLANRRRTITLIVLAFVVVLVALLGGLTLLPSATPSPSGVPVGTAAPEFMLPVYGGGGSGLVDLRALRGHPVLLNFWSESCPPCRVEMPFLQRTYAQYGAPFSAPWPRTQSGKPDIEVAQAASQQD